MSDVNASPARVTIVDVQMPFGSMIVFILKWTIASIPALIVLGLLALALSGVVAGVFMAAT